MKEKTCHEGDENYFGVLSLHLKSDEMTPDIRYVNDGYKNTRRTHCAL